MKEQFNTYLKTIGMSDIFTKRVEEIHEFFKGSCPEEIADIFVCEFIKEDGTREYENLWFFSEKYAMEAKSFFVNDIFDMTTTHKRVEYWSIEKMHYDFAKATEKSRMSAKMRLKNSTTGIFKASKENCDFLRDIFRRHILQNFIL